MEVRVIEHQPKKKKDKKKKKKKMRYTPGTATFQMAVRGFNKGLRGATEGLIVQVEDWNRTWDRSAARRRDGALHDWIPNVGHSFEAGMIVASSAMRKVWKTVNYPSMANVIRTVVPPLWFRR